MKVLFWDLDHTLWDFKTNSREALEEGYVEYDLGSLGVGPVEEYIESYEKANDWCWAEYREGRMVKEELRGKRFKLAMEPWGLGDDVELGEKLGSHYIERSPYKTNLIEGTHEVLSRLKDAGFKMVVLTNGFEEVQHIKVSQSNLGQYFEEIITSDSLGFKKPHPQAYALALERVGVKPQDVIMIGDNFEADVMGAKEAGLGQIYFNPEGAKYEEEIDHEVKTLTEILDIVLH